MKKSIKMIVLLVVLLILYSYILVIQNLPDDVVAFEGENITMKTLLGLNIKTNSDTIETMANNNQSIAQKSGKATLEVSLFDNIPIKNVNVDIIPRTKVVPIGNIAGVKLYTSGVLVVGMSEIEGEDNKKYKPYENTGIEEGDTIIGIDDSKINTTDDLIETVNKSEGKNITVKYVHKEETKQCSMIPIKTSKADYKLGLWVRDSAARCRNSYFL